MDRQSSLSAIDSLLQSLISAWNSRDLEKYVSHWVEDLDFVNVLGMRHRTRDALLEELRFIHSGLLAGTQIHDQGHTVRLLFDDVAVVHMHWQMTNVPFRAGYCETRVRQGVFTHVVEHRGGAWRIVASQNTDVVDPSALLGAAA
jgi:uncharacterized protein (TIGR02246 family)